MRYRENEAERDIVGRIEGAGRGVAPRFTWQAVLYLLVLGVVCLVLIPLTDLWWIVPVLGAGAPISLALLDGISPAPRRPDKKTRERELLRALAEHGELTPATAAMRTPLTADEASKALAELARKGHLRPRAEDGVVAYALSERERRDLPPANAPSSDGAAGVGAPGGSRRPVDPLSEREIEVLGLLASGKTNSEVAEELFVSVGTVKSHTGNIYRKLDARNRAEAVARARGFGLLR